MLELESPAPLGRLTVRSRLGEQSISTRGRTQIVPLQNPEGLLDTALSSLSFLDRKNITIALQPWGRPHRIRLKDLRNVDGQKQRIEQNTRQFVEGAGFENVHQVQAGAQFCGQAGGAFGGMAGWGGQVGGGEEAVGCGHAFSLASGARGSRWVGMRSPTRVIWPPTVSRTTNSRLPSR